MNGTPLWTSAEAAEVTGGSATGVWAAGGVSIDSRTAEPGDLFVAIRGPENDGHDYVRAALSAGAAAAVVHRRPDGVGADAPLLLVDDTLDALTALGRRGRDRGTARVAAVTGSAGKTGTKEALRHALAGQGAVAASAASYNNLWGVPLSLARMPPGSAFGAFEVGMNHAGEIAPLSRLIRPHVAVITNVEAAHIAFFPSLEAVADAKAEIFEGVEPGGACVLNRDNMFFDRLRASAARRPDLRIVSFGLSDADAAAREVSLDEEGSDVAAEICGRRIAYRVALPGRHWVLNSLAVLAAVEALGADAEEAAAQPAIPRAAAGTRQAAQRRLRRRDVHADRRKLQRKPGLHARGDRDPGPGSAPRRGPQDRHPRPDARARPRVRGVSRGPCRPAGGERRRHRHGGGRHAGGAGPAAGRHAGRGGGDRRGAGASPPPRRSVRATW